jgi:hypothetical protein
MELLPKLPPFTVKTNPAPPAVALVGEIELIDGVAGQPPHETNGSNKIANAAIIAIGVHVRQIGSWAGPPGRSFGRIISIAMYLVVRIDMII